MPPPRLKRSNVAGAVPASLADGEIAINQADGKLYYQTVAGGVATFLSVPTAHKSSHATGGVDALSAADIGALTQTVADARYVNQTGDTMTGGLAIAAANPLTVTGGRTFLAPDGEPYGLGVRYVSTGGPVYFGATDATATPGAQISRAGGSALMTWTHAGAASIPGTLTVGGHAVVVTNDARLSDSRTPTDASVTTAKLADGSVTTAKIAEGAVITVDIANSAVTYAKIQNVSATDRLLGRSSAGAGVVEEIVCTSYGRSLLSGADAAATRTTLGLGTAATSASTSFAASAHTHAATDIVSGTLADARLSANVVLTTDSRLSDARTPNAHTHGNLTNAGAIGATANLPVITTTSGVLTTGSFGTTANTFCVGNDPRLSDSRTPASHTHAATDITSGTLADARLSANVVLTADPRLSDSRTPTAHTHGNITNLGAIGTTSGLPIITTTSGVLSAGAFGTVAGSFCQGDDSRLSNARTPTAHTHPASAITDFATESAKYGPVTSVNGLTGAVTVPGVADGNKGDITVSASGATWTINANAVITADIANSAVTYAKIQNVSATDRILGRSTAGAGVVEEITCTSFGRSVIAGADAAAVRTTLNAVSKGGDTISGALTCTGAITGQTGLNISGGRSLCRSNDSQYGVGSAYGVGGGYVYFGAVSAHSTPDAAISNAGGGTLMTLQNGGNVGIGTASPAVRLDVSGVARASSGIRFGTDTAAANTLADYEEGTWTPTFIQGFSSVTFASATGRYIKIGKMVIAHLRLNVSAFTGNGSVVAISLPFTASTQSAGGGFVHTGGALATGATVPPAVTGPDGSSSAANLYKTIGEGFTASDFGTPPWTIGFTVLYTAD